MSTAASQFKFFLRGEVIVDETYDLKKWRIPDQIIRFISNVPRAIQAEKLHDTKWVMRHIWNFFDFKVNIDADDISRGQPLQMFADFIIDTLLQRCERRVDAEIYLYLLLKSLQSCLAKKKTPLLHSFARFLGVFGTTDEEDQSELVSSVTEATVPRHHSNGNSPHKHKQNDKKDKIHKKASSTDKNFVNRGSKVTVENTHMKVPNTNLSREILDVYLFSRSCMLRPYHGIYANGIEQAKQASTGLINLNKNQCKVEGSEADHAAGWGLNIPPHVLISDNLTSWVPLDRALEVSTAVLNFLSERQMLALNRQIEHEAMFLTKHGHLEEPEGSHSVIRAAVRRILKNTPGDGQSGDDGDANEDDDDTIIVVNMEKILQA
jgi:hypothetical protein